MISSNLLSDNSIYKIRFPKNKNGFAPASTPRVSDLDHLVVLPGSPEV